LTYLKRTRLSQYIFYSSRYIKSFYIISILLSYTICIHLIFIGIKLFYLFPLKMKNAKLNKNYWKHSYFYATIWFYSQSWIIEIHNLSSNSIPFTVMSNMIKVNRYEFLLGYKNWKRIDLLFDVIWNEKWGDLR
jgi:hypothetical protein